MKRVCLALLQVSSKHMERKAVSAGSALLVSASMSRSLAEKEALPTGSLSSARGNPFVHLWFCLSVVAWWRHDRVLW